MISWDSRSPGRNLNPGTPEYEAGVLTARPLLSLLWILSSRLLTDDVGTSNNIFSLHSKNESRVTKSPVCQYVCLCVPH
jgi:hypothetical protein